MNKNTPQQTKQVRWEFKKIRVETETSRTYKLKK